MRAAALAAQRAASRRARASLTSQTWTVAPRSAKALAIARPKPCAAPVTMTTRPSKAMFMARPPAWRSRRRRVRRDWRGKRPLAVFDLVDHLDRRAVSGVAHAELCARSRRSAGSAHRPRSCACGWRDRARCRNATWSSAGCARPCRRSERSVAPDGDPGAKALGSKPSNASALTPFALATAPTSSPSADSTGR